MNSLHHASSAVKTQRATPTPTAQGLDGIPIIAAGRTSGFFMPQSKSWYRKVIASKHFLQKPKAITFDCTALALALDMGATSIRIVDSETGTEYTAPIQHVTTFGFDLDRGFGKQKALLLGYFIQSDKRGNVKPATLPKAAPVAAVEPEAQPSLFDFAETKRGGY
jgi:hypothetical protein